MVDKSNAFRMDPSVPLVVPEVNPGDTKTHHGIIAGPMGRTGKDTSLFVGNSAHPVLATRGGFVELLVKLNDKVEAGQRVAVQRNAFGEVVARNTAAASPARSRLPHRRDVGTGQHPHDGPLQPHPS